MKRKLKTENYDVTCSIVAYESDPDELRLAIRSFLRTSLRVKLVVVDNSPTDALRTLSESEGAEYFFCSRNLGFGAGHNLALRDCLHLSKYHLVLNSDAYLESGALEKVVSYLEAHPRIGLLSPKVLYPNGALQYACKLLPTPVDLIGRRFLRGPLMGLIRRRSFRYELRDLDFDRVLSVPAVAGCCMFFRTEALKQAGLFDERFFMYLEDFDLSRRIKTAYDIVYYPGAQVVHRADRGSHKDPKLLRFHILSAIHYFSKWGWFFDQERRAENRRALMQEGRPSEIAVRQTPSQARPVPSPARPPLTSHLESQIAQD